MSQSEKELTQKAFVNREYAFKHTSFEQEFAFYNYVKNGDVDKVMQMMTPLGVRGFSAQSEVSFHCYGCPDNTVLRGRGDGDGNGVYAQRLVYSESG